MPWWSMRTLEMETSTPASFMTNNLASDGDSRLAFAQGKRVRCTKRLSSVQSRHDFALAYSEKLEVTSLHWWTGVERCNRPLLVLTTESSSKSPATLQVWNVARGTGIRIFRCDVNEFEKETSHETSRNMNVDLKPIQFSRGLAQASSGPSGQILFSGTSNGSVFGIDYRQGKDGGFKRVCALRNFSHPLVTLAGDRKQSNLLAGSDEAGNLIVWNVEEELDRDGTNVEDYRSTVLYTYFQEDDFISSIGIRDKIVIAGHASGYVTFHCMDRKSLLASVVTNTKAVTCIDLYEHKNLVLVCGEDGRVTVLGFSLSHGYRPVVHFSVALDSIVVGCAFSNGQTEFPRIAMMTWEKCKLVQFVYHKTKDKDKEDRSTYVQDSKIDPRRVHNASCSPRLSCGRYGQSPATLLAVAPSAENLVVEEDDDDNPFQIEKKANKPVDMEVLLISSDEVRMKTELLG